MIPRKEMTHLSMVLFRLCKLSNYTSEIILGLVVMFFARALIAKTKMTSLMFSRFVITCCVEASWVIIIFGISMLHDGESECFDARNLKKFEQMKDDAKTPLFSGCRGMQRIV